MIFVPIETTRVFELERAAEHALRAGFIPRLALFGHSFGARLTKRHNPPHLKAQRGGGIYGEARSQG